MISLSTRTVVSAVEQGLWAFVMLVAVGLIAASRPIADAWIDRAARMQRRDLQRRSVGADRRAKRTARLS